jgi:predicted nucleic acid-binding protein
VVVTAVDTNVLVTLLRADAEQDVRAAQSALEAASALGDIVISPVVYAELLAAPRVERDFLENFLKDTRIRVEWRLTRTVWEHAAEAFKAYAERRRKSKRDPGPKRILADFLIGAHASAVASRFLTFDSKVYRQAFPKLELIALPESA